mmetsp:Transcript_20322/g.29109  ORF Transcript_20322/g.29109 Transcript_20322/m.29109 type:complete len:1857 (+) Transcript_20322:2-5572(+)
MKGLQNNLNLLIGSKSASTSAWAPQEVIFSHLVCKSSTASLVDFVLSKFVSATASISAITPFEAMRIWDRVISDFGCKSANLNNALVNSVEVASNFQSSIIYSFPAFASMIDKEMHVRLATHTKLMNDQMTSKGSENRVPQFSYLKNANGFFKTGPNVCAHLLTSEYVKDNFHRQFGQPNASNGVDVNSQIFWMDILHVVSNLSHQSLSGNHEILVVSSSSLVVAADVIRIASIYNQNNYVPTTLFSKLSFTGPQNRFSTNNFLFEAIKNFTLSFPTLHFLKLEMRKIFKFDSLINSKSLVRLTELFSSSVTHAVDEINRKYGSIEIDDTENLLSFGRSVWHLQINQQTHVSQISWKDIFEIVELRSAAVCDFFACIHRNFDPRTNVAFRKLINDFKTSQKLVISVSGANDESEFFNSVNFLPGMISKIRYLPLYNSYATHQSYLTNLCGPETALHIYDLMRKYWKDMAEPHVATYAEKYVKIHKHISKCEEYVDQSVDLVIRLYSMAKHTNVNIWKKSFTTTATNSEKCDLKLESQSKTSGDNSVALEVDLAILSLSVFNAICCRFFVPFNTGDLMNLINILYREVGEVTQYQLPSLLTKSHVSLYSASTYLSFHSGSQRQNMANMLTVAKCLPPFSDAKIFLSCKILMLLCNCQIKLIDETFVYHFLLQEVCELNNTQNWYDESHEFGSAAVLVSIGEVSVTKDNQVNTFVVVSQKSTWYRELSNIYLLQRQLGSNNTSLVDSFWAHVCGLESGSEKANTEYSNMFLQTSSNTFSVNTAVTTSTNTTATVSSGTAAHSIEALQILSAIFGHIWFMILESETRFHTSTFFAYWNAFTDVIQSKYLQSTTKNVALDGNSLLLSSIYNYLDWLRLHKVEIELWGLYLRILSSMVLTAQARESLLRIFEIWKSPIGQSASFIIESSRVVEGGSEHSGGSGDEVCSLSETAKRTLHGCFREIFRIHSLQGTPPLSRPGSTSTKGSGVRSSQASIRQRPSTLSSGTKQRTANYNMEAELYATGIFETIEEKVNDWLLWASDSSTQRFIVPPSYPSCMDSENSLPLLLEKLSIAVVLKPSAALQTIETFLQTVLNQKVADKLDFKMCSVGNMTVVCDPTNRVNSCYYLVENTNTFEPKIQAPHSVHHFIISHSDLLDSGIKYFLSNITLLNNFKNVSEEHAKESMIHIVVNRGENLLQPINEVLNSFSWTEPVCIEANLLPIALNPSALLRNIKFPSILKGLICANLFESVLRDNFRGVTAMMISKPSDSASHIHRFRWLMLFFHSCLECQFATDIHSRHVIVSIDLLYRAFDLIDNLFSQDLAVASAPKMIDYTGNGAGLCPSNFNHLIEYIIDCVYSTAAHTDAEKGTVRAIFRRVFASGFQDCSSLYHIRDSIVLPHLFGEGDSSVAFLKRVSHSVELEVGPMDWIGRSMPEENSLQRSFFKTALQRFQANLSSSQVMRGPVTEDTLGMLRNTFSKLLALLPATIKTESREIMQQMTGHVRLLAGAGGGSHPHRPPRTPPQGGARRQGNRLLARYQSREFDPLWAFVLSECFEFNKLVESLRIQLQDFSDASDELLHRRLQSCTAGNSFMSWLDHLRRGLVPISWVCDNFDFTASSSLLSSSLPSSCDPLTLDDWLAMLQERRKIIADWLLSGQPGLLKLSLLRSPSSLLHALKEKFSMNLDGAVDKLHCKVTLLDRAGLSPQLIASMKDPNLNFGCNVLVEDCYLHNATYRFGDEDDEDNNGMLEILPSFSSSAFGQKVVLQISASDRISERFAEDYLCPLMVTSELPPVALQLLPADTALAAADLSERSAMAYEIQWRRKNACHLLQVPLLVQDDLDDSNVNNIALHCTSRWRLPS